MTELPSDDPRIALENEGGSGFLRLLGYRLNAWSEGYAEMILDLEPKHRNRAGVLHGGVIASMLDSACGYAATWAPPGASNRLCVTLSLTTSFTGQMAEGRLRVVGRVKGGGRKIVFCAAEAFDESGALIAFGEGTFRYRSGSERS